MKAHLGTDGVYRCEFTVPEEAIDENGHVNNVVYIQWMQAVAIQHSEVTGGTAAAHALGGSWVVRSHKVEYLRPAYAGDVIEALTGVVDFRRVRSMRRYRFLRKSEDRLLARGETDWVYVHGANGRPCGIPQEVRRCFCLLPDFTG